MFIARTTKGSASGQKNLEYVTVATPSTTARALKNCIATTGLALDRPPTGQDTARMRIGLAVLAGLLLGVGCGYGYTQTTSHVAGPKPEGCVFDLLSVRPDRPFDELGVIDSTSGSAYAVSDARSFMEWVRPDVCRAGGDAVIAEVNGLGHYVRGIVIKYRKQ